MGGTSRQEIRRVHVDSKVPARDYLQTREKQMITEGNKENERDEDSPELESASFSSFARGEEGHNLSGGEPGK
jgi:hypothetical protein